MVTERAWAAGFFDGEGYSRHAPVARQIRMDVRQVDRGVLDRLQRTIGGKVYGPYSNGKWSPLWMLTVNGAERFQYALCVMWEFLSPIKREQAVRAFVAYQTTL